MKEFIVNEYITLKLEKGKTNIYVNRQLFRQCKFLLINIPIEGISSFNEIESIDEASERLERSLEQRGGQQEIKIPPETEFWGHSSNLQVWAENNYNTRLLTRNLAFPLLKKLSSLDPTANEIFKEEIAKRFNSGNINVMEFLIKQKYLDYLETQEEREAIFYNNSEKIRELVDDFLQRMTKLNPYEQIILRRLIKLGDGIAKEKVSEFLLAVLTSKDLEMPNLIGIVFLLRHFFVNKEDREMFFYKNNPKIRAIIDKALETGENALKIGLEFLVELDRLGDPDVRQRYKDTVLKLFFVGNVKLLKTLVLTYLFRKRGCRIYKYKNTQLKQQLKFFNYGELEGLAKDPRCPKQFLPFWNNYKEKSDSIIHFLEDLFVPREELLKGTDFLSRLKIPDSDYFLMIKDEREGRREQTPIPIYNKQVKKIIINSSESPIRLIFEKIESLRSRLEFIYEAYHCTNISRIGRKNSYELYFLDSNKITNEEIKEIFTSISKDIKIKFN